MLNLTARLALKIQNLPNWDFEWSDTHPQWSRQSLTISNFLPSEDDAQQLKKWAVLYMMEFLATEFKSLADLKHLIPSQQSLHPVQKSVVVPMKVLYRDKKYNLRRLRFWHNWWQMHNWLVTHRYLPPHAYNFTLHCDYCTIMSIHRL